DDRGRAQLAGIDRQAGHRELPRCAGADVGRVEGAAGRGGIPGRGQESVTRASLGDVDGPHVLVDETITHDPVRVAVFLEDDQPATIGLYERRRGAEVRRTDALEAVAGIE